MACESCSAVIPNHLSIYLLRTQVLSKRADGSEERVRLVYDHDLLDSYTEMPQSHAIHHHQHAAFYASGHYGAPPPARQNPAIHTATKVASAAAATCAAI